jgi:hypothetical protein
MNPDPSLSGVLQSCFALRHSFRAAIRREQEVFEQGLIRRQKRDDSKMRAAWTLLSPGCRTNAACQVSARPHAQTPQRRSCCALENAGIKSTGDSPNPACFGRKNENRPLFRVETVHAEKSRKAVRKSAKHVPNAKSWAYCAIWRMGAQASCNEGQESGNKSGKYARIGLHVPALPASTHPDNVATETPAVNWGQRSAEETRSEAPASRTAGTRERNRVK